jgi:hypothetical protein
MTLLERIRSATPADLNRDAADVLGLRAGDAFRFSKDGLTVGGETVPGDVVLAEMLRVLGDPAPAEPAPSRIVIADLGP